MDGSSLDLTAEKIAQMRALFPEVFAEDKIDFDRLKDVLGANLAFPNEHYELSWAGKAEARKEIQKQTTATLIPDKARSINFEASENIFIEGENLEVLRVLQKSYFGKIKMIYIDPPYNTGNDSFVFPDDYAERLPEYQKRAGITDEEGFLNKQDLWHKNTRENGQFHSVWLSMMYPRLYLARNLLSEDGVIFVSIDDNEVANLRLVMDEVFGAENFFATLVRRAMHTVRNSSKDFNQHADYVLTYARNKQWFAGPKERYIRQIVDKTGNYPYDDNDGRGAYKLDPLSARNYYKPYHHVFSNGIEWEAPEGSFPRYAPDTLEEMEKDNRIEFNRGEPKAKRYLREVQEGQPPNTILSPEDVGFNSDGTRELREAIVNDKVFSQPKPIELVSFLQGLLRDKNSIVLDFFSGSSTTAQAILELNEGDGGNRKFICVQMPEVLEEGSEGFKAFYRTIADIGRTRIKKVVEQMQSARAVQIPMGETRQILGFQAYHLAASNFKTWRGDLAGQEQILEQLDMFRASHKEGSQIENMLFELLLKAGLPLTTKIETVQVEGQTVYLVDGNKLLVFFDAFSPVLKEFIHQRKPQRVVCLDRVFNGNDEVVTNLKLELKEAGIELTIL